MLPRSEQDPALPHLPPRASPARSVLSARLTRCQNNPETPNPEPAAGSHVPGQHGAWVRPLHQGTGAGCGPRGFCYFNFCCRLACLPENSCRERLARAARSIASFQRHGGERSWAPSHHGYPGMGEVCRLWGRVPAPFMEEKAATSGLCCWMSPSPSHQREKSIRKN